MSDLLHQDANKLHSELVEALISDAPSMPLKLKRNVLLHQMHHDLPASNTNLFRRTSFCVLEVSVAYLSEVHDNRTIR